MTIWKPLTFHCNLPFKNVTLSHVWCVHTRQVSQTFLGVAVRFSDLKSYIFLPTYDRSQTWLSAKKNFVGSSKSKAPQTFWGKILLFEMVWLIGCTVIYLQTEESLYSGWTTLESFLTELSLFLSQGYTHTHTHCSCVQLQQSFFFCHTAAALATHNRKLVFAWLVAHHDEYYHCNLHPMKTICLRAISYCLVPASTNGPIFMSSEVGHNFWKCNS